MVVKDANGGACVANISVSTSEKKWLFNEIYKTIFMTLYSEETIKHNCLILTDEDCAKYKPVVNAIKTIKTYKNTTHMICVFHAVAKKFKEVLFPSLPHNKCSKNLSPLGEKYGEKLCAMCFFTCILVNERCFIPFDFYMAAVPVQ